MAKKVFMELKQSPNGYEYSEECFKDCGDKTFFIHKKFDFESFSFGYLSDVIGYVDNVTVEEGKLVGDCTILDNIFKDIFEYCSVVPALLIHEKDDNNRITECKLLGFSINLNNNGATSQKNN